MQPPPRPGTPPSPRNPRPAPAADPAAASRPASAPAPARSRPPARLRARARPLPRPLPGSRPRSRAAAAAAVVTAVAVLLAGCSGAGGGAAAGSGGSGTGEPPLGRVAVDPPTASLTLPLDAYADSAEEARRSDLAQRRLVSRCMARFGFAYEPPARTGGTGTRAEGHRWLYGLTDPRHAAVHGYDREAGRPRPAREPAAALSDSARTVLHGQRPGETGPAGPDPRTQEEAARTDSGLVVGGLRVPAGGCLREGYRTLYAPHRDSVDLLFAFGLAAEAHTRARRDSRVVAALTRWSACLARSGYRGVASPYELPEKLGPGTDPGGPAAVAAAVRDVACKREVNLVGVWAAVETAHQHRLAERHAETLALFREQREARFRLAARLG
ncbi:hypothetical protein [Streptomyces sp. NPDC097619]|uniref:hypothetical protein n=1 Tax=Streptomyces sp. NPDC097619 TaxID=3157228 RepID=UPI003330D0BF